MCGVGGWRKRVDDCSWWVVLIEVLRTIHAPFYRSQPHKLRRDHVLTHATGPCLRASTACAGARRATKAIPLLARAGPAGKGGGSAWDW